MDAWVIALLMLAAILTGACLPLLFQLRSTLRSAQRILDDGGPKLLRTLEEVQRAAQQINAVAATVAAGQPQATAFFESVARLTATVNRARSVLDMATALGAAVGPAVSAAVHAFRQSRADGPCPEDDAPEETPAAGADRGGDPAARGES